MKKEPKAKRAEPRAVTVHTPGRKVIYVVKQEARRLADGLFEFVATANDEDAMKAFTELRMLLTVMTKHDRLKPAKLGAVKTADRLVDALQNRLNAGGRRRGQIVDAELVPVNLPVTQAEAANGRGHDHE